MKFIFNLKNRLLLDTAFLWIFSLLSFNDGGSIEATDEYKVKLAVIERIIIHIEWAKDARVFDTTKPFIFGIYGDVSPFGDALLGLKNDRKLKWKNVEIKFYEKPEDLLPTYPDLLFVPKEFSDKMEEATGQLKDSHTLIVADENGLEKKGALVSVFMKDEKLKIKLNYSDLDAKGFKVSDELVRLVGN